MASFARWTIGRRILAVNILTVTIGAGTAGVVALTAIEIKHKFASISQEQAETNGIVRTVEIGAKDYERLGWRLLASPGRKQKRETKKLFVEVRDSIEAALEQAAALAPGQAEAIADLVRRNAAAVNTFAVLEAGLFVGDKNSAAETAAKLSDGPVTDMLTATREFSESIAELQEKVVMTADSDSTHSVELAIAASGLLALASLGLAVLVSRQSIVNPLRRLTVATERLAAGDYLGAIPGVERTDEIGILARTIDALRDATHQVESMRQRARENEVWEAEQTRQSMLELAASFEASVERIVETVSATAASLTGKAEALALAAQHTSRAAETVYSASNSAASDVEQIASTTGAIIATMSGTSDKIIRAGRASGLAANQARGLTLVVQGMNEAAGRIDSIRELIGGVAAQTDLLALNATIEAARGGDAGRGFSVVANEVKTLANQTTKATEDIGLQIERVKSVSANTVMSISEVAETVEETLHATQEAQKAMEEMIRSMRAIDDSTSNAAGLTQSVRRSVTAVIETAEDTSRSADELLTLSAELSSHSDGLRSSVAAFLERIRS